MTKNILLDNLSRPEFLEEVYHRSPKEFEKQLNVALEKNRESETLKVWNARLSYTPFTLQKISVKFLIVVCSIAVIIVKLPAFLPMDGGWFYPRFVPVVVISALISYFLKTVEMKGNGPKVVISGIALCVLYLLILPESKGSDSVTMALVHLPMFVFSLMAVSFMGDGWKNVAARLDFIRYLGEMGIYSALILLGGMVLTAITIGLFNLIDLPIERWYMDYVVVSGLVSAPLVATYLFDSIQNRQSKFASILSNVFTPLFLITVLVYIGATIYEGKSPFTDRDFLITFNGLLVVILALVIFSISGKKWIDGTTVSDYINVLLIGATLAVNVIALSAILFRWAEYGLTVNRVVVTGANILIFFHLVLLMRQYIGHLNNGGGQNRLETTVAKYLPVYTLWSLVVAVFLPLAFWYK